MIHWCADETAAVMMGFPAIVMLWQRIRCRVARWCGRGDR